MPTTIYNVRIKRSVFNWLITTSGWSDKELANKLNYSEREILELLVSKKDVELPINKVELLASLIKRPLSVFFISSPPHDSTQLADFRKLSKNSSKSYSKETSLAIRKARRLQKISRTLMVSSDIRFRKENEYNISKNSAEEAAIIERNLSGIPINEQKSWDGDYIAFRRWKDWIESKNMFVFQMDFPIEDARGFSLIDIEPYIIVLSVHDSVRGRIFSLFHEYAHILLRKPAVCNLESFDSHKSEIKKIERWCDAFAGAFILPSSEISKHIDNKEKIFKKSIKSTIQKISSEYRISELGALVRLGNLQFIQKEQYREEYLRLLQEFELKKVENIKKKEEREQQTGGISGEKRALNEKGKKFSNFILENSRQGKLSEIDVLDYLDIRAKNLPKLQEALNK